MNGTNPHLNPEAQGRERAAALVEEAMVAGRVLLTCGQSETPLDSLPGPRLISGRAQVLLGEIRRRRKPARVKVYVRHLDATTPALEQAAQPVTWHHPGEIAEFAQAMGAPAEGPLHGCSPADLFCVH